MGPGHPLPDGGSGLQNGLDEGGEIGFSEGTELETTGGKHGAGTAEV